MKKGSSFYCSRCDDEIDLFALDLSDELHPVIIQKIKEAELIIELIEFGFKASEGFKNSYIYNPYVADGMDVQIEVEFKGTKVEVDYYLRRERKFDSSSIDVPLSDEDFVSQVLDFVKSKMTYGK